MENRNPADFDGARSCVVHTYTIDELVAVRLFNSQSNHQFRSTNHIPSIGGPLLYLKAAKTENPISNKMAGISKIFERKL